MHKVEEILDEAIVVEDMSSLNGTGEIIGPYLDMVCMSSGDSYRDAVIFIIVNHASQQLHGIIKIDYNQTQHQKYLYFSGFLQLSRENLHFIVKDLNRHSYDFKIFKSVSEVNSGKTYKRLEATSYIGISYANYQHLLLCQEDEMTLNFENVSGGENSLIG